MALTPAHTGGHPERMTESHVFEVTEANFQEAVVERSMTQPVLLDFWASWCEPCKSFTPVLLQLAEDYGGGFALGTVDIEAQAQLSKAFQVQSVPFCMLLVGGRPADGFAGAVGEDELHALLRQHGVEPKDGPADDEVRLVPADEACLAAASEAARGGDVTAALAALAGFPEDSTRVQERENLERGLVFLSAEIPPEATAGRLLEAARQSFLQARYEEALLAIVDSAREDRAFGDGLARRGMLLCQGVVSDAELVETYRRQLATLLY